MATAGFVDIAIVDRNAWYRDVARGELERLEGPALRDRVAAAVGAAYVDKNIRTWEAMQKVLDSGEHRPTHLQRPGSLVDDRRRCWRQTHDEACIAEGTGRTPASGAAARPPRRPGGSS